MRRLIAALVVAASVIGFATPAFAAEKHPPKFGVGGNQCASDSNQPHCPGNH